MFHYGCKSGCTEDELSFSKVKLVLLEYVECFRLVKASSTC